MARPKTEFHMDVEALQQKARMINEGRAIVAERWDEIVNAMIECAVKKKSPTAANWIRDTFIGKPKETIDEIQDKVRTIEDAIREARDGKTP